MKLMGKIGLILFLIALNFKILTLAVVASGVNGNAQISGQFDGSPIVIKTTDRLAGAIDSLVWKGKEFVNSLDHGHQIQYAWFLNGNSECENPTEAGSSNDGSGSTSSSQLLNLTTGNNWLTTVSHPAYWMAPGQFSSDEIPGGSCGMARNTTVVSDHILQKTVTIGWNGLENVIEFLANISIPHSINSVCFEAPTGYQPWEFSTFWQYNPDTGLLTDVSSQVTPPTCCQNQDFPIIIATANGQYAIGSYLPSYSPLIKENEGERVYGFANFPGGTTKWNAILCYYSQPARDYAIRTYVVIGTLDQVKTTIGQLHEKFKPEAKITIDNLRRIISGDIKVFNYNNLVAFYGQVGNFPWEGLKEGLLHYWRFDEASWYGLSGEIKDMTGRSNGRAVGAIVRPGFINNGGFFNGTGGYADLNSYLPSLVDNLTISFWVKPAGGQVFLANILGNSGGNYTGLVIQQNASSQNQFYFSYGDGSRWIYSNSVQLTADVWQHFAITKDKNNCVLFVNGEATLPVSCPNPIVPNSSMNLRVGMGFDGGGRFFSGTIDELGIWNRALTAQKVKTLYNNGQGLAP